MKNPRELTVEELYHRCDFEQFDFETTSELQNLTEVIGQPRAVEAIQFGIDIQKEGYNLFALGPVGSGKRSLLMESFKLRAEKETTPVDWCYVHNFEQPHCPRALSLPAGKGKAFKEDMKEFTEELRSVLTSAFESDNYQTRRQVLQEEYEEKQQVMLENIRKKSKEKNIVLLKTPVGFVFAPTRNGEVLSPEELDKLPTTEQEKLEVAIDELEEELQKILKQTPQWQRELREKLKKLNREVTDFAVGGLIQELLEKYKDFPVIQEHFKEVQKDVIENVKDFLSKDEDQEALQKMINREQEGANISGFRRYFVNVIVDQSETKGAPVIYEDNPTYQNIVGRVEHKTKMGTLQTDFNLIKGGALHQANGGYLLIDARKILLNPYAWEGIKRALLSGEIRIESLGEMLSLVSTVSLTPEPIPLNVKIALFGERTLYYLLYHFDPEFGELFKVIVDFDDTMDRSAENEELYARLIATIAQQEEVKPLDRKAVARVIEHSSRLSSDSEKLSTHRRSLSDVIREADYWAKKAQHKMINVSDVQKAIDSQIYRSDRLREKIQEEIQRGHILIDTKGLVVGQINALSVLMLGGFAFGRPSRITAQVSMGKGEVLDIEREVDLGGPLHSKGILILSGYLKGRYLENKPLSLSASLVFEQSYGGIDGDSASSAELYALLSAIAKIPIKQSLAVTGSVNQHGQVQAIGGVNYKIEGFFDVCQAQGLSGEQGVLIPATNVKHLMLREDVVQAVEKGKFHIYPVETIDQGIEILTGLSAGVHDKKGKFPQKSINGKVEKALSSFAQKVLDFKGKAGKKTKEEL